MFFKEMEDNIAQKAFISLGEGPKQPWVIIATHGTPHLKETRLTMCKMGFCVPLTALGSFLVWEEGNANLSTNEKMNS